MLLEWRPGEFTPEALSSMNTNTSYIEREIRKEEKEMVKTPDV